MSLAELKRNKSLVKISSGKPSVENKEGKSEEINVVGRDNCDEEKKVEFLEKEENLKNELEEA